MGVYHKIWHVEVILCYFNDFPGRKYARDQVFSTNFDHFFSGSAELGCCCRCIWWSKE